MATDVFSSSRPSIRNPEEQGKNDHGGRLGGGEQHSTFSAEKNIGKGAQEAKGRIFGENVAILVVVTGR